MIPRETIKKNLMDQGMSERHAEWLMAETEPTHEYASKLRDEEIVNEERRMRDAYRTNRVYGFNGATL